MVLARLLAIAATATASSLVENGRPRSDNPFNRNMIGHGSPATPASFNNPTSETSFDGFLAGLRSGLLATELSNSLHSANQATPRRAMNFFRMFRFTPTSQRRGSYDSNLVPILIVGVRAVENNEHDSDGETQSPEQSRSDDSDLFNRFQDTLDGDDLFNPVNEAPWSRPGARRSSAARRSDTRLGGVSERYSTSLDESPERETEEVPEEQPMEQSRQSWIVYVFGGTYPENHPILLAPTLFSDDPTYEDLMVLESFMGQVKPPVATSDEVHSAGGLFMVRNDTEDPAHLQGFSDDSGIVGQAIDGRCLICLSDFEADQECRQLNNCRHMFHRECIDQWLTTGRNSCPLCRSEGVKKHERDESEATPAPVPSL